LILATLLVTGVNAQVLLTVLAGVALFLAREPLGQSVKLRFGRKPRPVPRALCFWAGVYLTISGVAGGILVIQGELWGLVWMAMAGLIVLAVHLTMVARRLMMTAWGEWIGVLGVSLIIPALCLAAREALDIHALGLWLIGLAQVTGPIFYIRLKVRTQARLSAPPPVSQRLLAAWRPLLFSAVSLMVVMALGAWGWVPAWAWLALTPSAIKHLWGALDWTPRGQLDIRRLGWIEVANILLFAAILGGVYWLGGGASLGMRQGFWAFPVVGGL
jgi:hypothetical protein